MDKGEGKVVDKEEEGEVEDEEDMVDKAGTSAGGLISFSIVKIHQVAFYTNFYHISCQRFSRQLQQKSRELGVCVCVCVCVCMCLSMCLSVCVSVCLFAFCIVDAVY